MSWMDPRAGLFDDVGSDMGPGLSSFAPETSAGSRPTDQEFSVPASRPGFQSLLTSRDGDGEFAGGRGPDPHWQDLTDHVDRVTLAQQVQCLVRAAFNAPDRLQFVANSIVNLMFYQGYQSRELSATPGTIEGIENLLQRLRYERARVHYRDNLFADVVRIMLAQRVFKRPQPHVEPEQDTQSARFQARSMERFINWFWDHADLDRTRRRAAWWRLMGGACALKIIRNKWGGGRRLVGNRIVIEPEIEVVPLRPQEWAADPYAKRNSDLQCWHHVTHVPIGQAQATWGKRLKYLNGTDEVPRTSMEFADPLVSGLFRVEGGVPRYADHEIPMTQQTQACVAITESWLAPTREFPQGLVVTLLGPHLMQAVTWPTDAFPVVFSLEEETDASFYGYTPLNDIRDHCVMRNVCLSMLVETLDRFRPKRQIHRMEWDSMRGAQEDESQDLTDEVPDDVEVYTTQPSRLGEWPTVPPIIQWVLAFLEERVRSRTGATQTSNWQVPKGADTATHIMAMQEQSDIRLAPLLSEDERMWKQGIKQVLELARLVYPYGKLIRTTGSMGEVYVEEFLAAEIPEEFQVNFIADSTAPMSRAVRHAQLRDLAQVFAQFGLQMTKSEILQGIEWPGWQHQIEAQRIDEENAMAEERLFEQGVYRDPMTFDDHAAHIHFHVHQARVRSLKAPPQEMGARRRHIEEHRKLMLPPGAAEQMQGNGGMGAPGGTDPRVAALMQRLGPQGQQRLTAAA